MAKKSGGGATAPKPVVKPAPKVAPKTTAPVATPAKPAPAKGPVKTYSSPPKPTTPKPIQSPAKAARVMSSPKPVASAPTSTVGSRVASAMTSKVAKTAGKSLLKTAGKALLKGVPYVGAAVGAYELGSAAYDAYKENKKANTPKGTGDIMSTMEKNKGKSFGPSTSSSKGPVKPGGRSAASVTQQKSNDAYYSKLANPSGKKTSTPAKARVVRTTTPAIAAPKREMPSGMSKPSAPGIQSKPEGRQATPAEIKAMTALKKGTKKDGTVRAGAAGKAKTIMRRADAINKRAAVKEARANVRAVKRSYKK